VDKQENQHLLDLPKVIAAGIASPAGAALISRFGVAGTLVGLALTAVIITVVSDLLKVYLARVSGAVTNIPGGFRRKSALRRFASRIRLPFSKSATPAPPRHPIVIGSVLGAGIAFLIGLSVVTAFELSVDKNLSCWAWNNCSTAASSTEGEASNTTTLPSILGGGQNTNSSTLAQVRPLAPPQPQQQPAPPNASKASTQASSSGSGQPSSSSSAQQQSSSEGYQQQSGQSSSSSSSEQQSPSGEYRQQSEHEQTTEDYQQQNPSSNSEYQQQSKDIQPTDKPGGQHQQAQKEETTAPLYLFTRSLRNGQQWAREQGPPPAPSGVPRSFGEVRFPRRSPSRKLAE